MKKKAMALSANKKALVGASSGTIPQDALYKKFQSNKNALAGASGVKRDTSQLKKKVQGLSKTPVTSGGMGYSPAPNPTIKSDLKLPASNAKAVVPVRKSIIENMKSLKRTTKQAKRLK